MRKGIGSSTITGDNAVHTLTIPGGATAFLIEAQNGDARYFFGGSTPSASVGHLLSVFQKEFFEDFNFSDFKIYVPTGVTVVVSFFA